MTVRRCCYKGKRGDCSDPPAPTNKKTHTRVRGLCKRHRHTAIGIKECSGRWPAWAKAKTWDIPQTRKDLAGQLFGKLRVLRHLGTRWWLCACLCGRETVVPRSCLTNGYTRSCGCLKAELSAKTSTLRSLREPDRSPPKRDPDMLAAWRNLRRAVYALRQRGIRSHNPWLRNFEAFSREVGARPSKYHYLARLNTKRGYLPGNVAWADYRLARPTLQVPTPTTPTLGHQLRSFGVTRAAYKLRIKAGWVPLYAARVPLQKRQVRPKRFDLLSWRRQRDSR